MSWTQWIRRRLERPIMRVAGAGVAMAAVAGAVVVIAPGWWAAAVVAVGAWLRAWWLVLVLLGVAAGLAGRCSAGRGSG